MCSHYIATSSPNGQPIVSSRHHRSAPPIPSPRVTWARPPSVEAAAEAPVATSSVTWAGNRLRPGDREVQNGEFLGDFTLELFQPLRYF